MFVYRVEQMMKEKKKTLKDTTVQCLEKIKPYCLVREIVAKTHCIIVEKNEPNAGSDM